MNQDIENIIKKWLKKHKDDGQWVSDYDGEFDLDSCCLDGDFDLNDLADEVLKVVVEKIKELPAFTSISDKCMGKVSDEAKKPRWGTNYLERETVLNLLSNLSPNKENK